MKAQIFSIRNAPVGFIGFLLLITTIGCRVFVNRVIGLDPVLLAQEDLHRMGLRKSERIRDPYGISEPKEFHLIVGFEQRGYQLNVQYWLFNSSSTAKKAAEVEWIWTFAAMPNFHPELNPEDVIGTGTWRRIHTGWKEWEKGPTDIYFVKSNLLVRIRTNGHPSDRLQFARDAARKIEAQIEAVLRKDGRTVISGGKDRDKAVRLWEVKTVDPVKTFKRTYTIESVNFSPDGKKIVSGGRDTGKSVRLWDADTGNLLKMLTGHTYAVASVSFSPDGKKIVSGGWGKTVRLWDVETGSLLKTLKGHKGRIASVSFSPDRKRVVSGSFDDTVRLWNVETGNLLKTLKGHKIYVTSVSFSPDGKTLASGNVDGSVWLWDVETGNLLKILRGHKGSIASVDFSPDGKRIVGSSVGRVVGDSVEAAILLWDTSLVK
ncbi:WD40 repeat domain-containing protein [Candidatus Poribacteria bacterium]|nr:WD40 repeat domain-containing protein [Candidatus Poribacteria bacterium]